MPQDTIGKGPVALQAGKRPKKPHRIYAHRQCPIARVKGEKNLHLPLQKLSPSIITSNERLKNRIGEEVFKGMDKDERINLQAKGLL
jgi:hypothetical protein